MSQTDRNVYWKGREACIYAVGMNQISNGKNDLCV
jgi:hypothetical protein